jgi:hypothetical protein
MIHRTYQEGSLKGTSSNWFGLHPCAWGVAAIVAIGFICTALTPAAGG